MWLRSELKAQAKLNLKIKYWPAFAVTLVVGILAGGGGGIFSQGSSLGKIRSSLEQGGPAQPPDLDNWLEELPHLGRLWSHFWPFIVGIGLFIAILTLTYQILVAPVIEVGGRRWFSRARETAFAPEVGMTFSHFKSGRYWPTVGGMFWKNLFLFFWSLLAALPLLGSFFLAGLLILDRIRLSGTDLPFGRPDHQDIMLLLGIVVFFFGSILLSIPRIVKSYSYRLTGWILADNTLIGRKRALQLSMELTRGHKWYMFVLDLSFIGWYLLGLLACGIGIIFVRPYEEAVRAELYARLRQLGADQGICSMEELGFVKVQQPGW